MKRIYCEYKIPIRIHDYFSIMIDNFPIVLLRRFDWMEYDTYTLNLYVFGCFIWGKIK